MRIFTEIEAKYGTEGRNLTQLYLKTSTNLAKGNNQVKFLLNCRRCKVIPACMNYQVHISFNNEKSQRELEKLMFKQKVRMLSIMIADAKRTMAALKKRKAFIYDHLERLCEPNDVERVKKMVENKANRVHDVVRARGQRKLDALKTRRLAEFNNQSEWIENTTNTPIPEYLERTLMLGPNFNVQDNFNIPYIETIAGIENAIKTKENAEEIRAEVATAMINYVNYKAQPRHHEHEWIRKDVAKSKRFLKDNPNILVTKADKGNKTVILAADEYHEKMQELLSDEHTYRVLPTDPSLKIIKKQNALVDGWLSAKHIDARTHRRLKTSSCHPPRIYGLPKIHKPNRPLRPVVSTIGSATYSMASYLANTLGKIVGKTEYHVRSSYEFAEQITGAQYAQNEILFSLDVTSLYTNVPVDYALQCVEEKWDEIAQHTMIDRSSFTAAVKLVLDSTFFMFQGKCYSQCFGVPMGSPLSPVIANLVLERLEQESMRALEAKQINVRLYRRYVDDCVFIAEEDKVETILQTFNLFHNKLQFTLEKELNGSIKFLDIMLTRNDNKIEMSWLPKQINGRYLDFSSESPFQHKNNTAIALIDRAIKLSDIKHRPKALKTATEMLQTNNYPHWFVQRVVKDRVHKHYNSMQGERNIKEGTKFVSTPYIPCLTEKLRKILIRNDIVLAPKPRDKIKTRLFSKLKDPIPMMKQRNVIYSIPCGANDQKVYIGQTGRKLEVRIAEHRNDTRKGDTRTGLSQHALQQGHRFDFDSTKVLDRIEHQENRTVAEMFHIKVCGEEKTVNLQRECTTFVASYNGLVEKLREKTRNDERRMLNRQPPPAQ